MRSASPAVETSSGMMILFRGPPVNGELGVEIIGAGLSQMPAGFATHAVAAFAELK
jgi:hypothetical protein